MLVRFSGSILPFYLIAEIIVIYFYIDSYGFFSYFIEAILSGVLGFFLIFKIGFENLKNSLVSSSLGSIFSSFGVGFGGFLILMPGILSDIFGLIIALASILIKPKDDTRNQNFRYDDEVIDVEIIDDKPNIR
ncbi:FxsA family protein [Campylobacter gastrosuis]|uniref:FxsA family protein n=1 Tax=Campylobacter gastrosuis TaxID=2974576 RepID=A0ABT7HNB9_9BACT|nr:FxsA family protein [Campylobacter gastrosuis]MDL0088329.1 FxsA family protein [Campylobacter gastrosuis]